MEDAGAGHKDMGLDTVELLMAFEEKFGIRIPDEAATQLTTPRKVTDYVVSKIGDRAATREQVAALVRQIVTYRTDIYDFSDDDNFVNDMNLDRCWWK